LLTELSSTSILLDVLRRIPLCASQRTGKETACNDSCVVTIVGYRGNSVYRVVASIPIWVTLTFLTKLDIILRNLYSSSQAHIICGDINIKYLTYNERKSKVDTLLKTYNVVSTVNFPTRIQGNPATDSDNQGPDFDDVKICKKCSIK
jgi:hypothetical protein